MLTEPCRVASSRARIRAERASADTKKGAGFGGGVARPR